MKIVSKLVLFVVAVAVLSWFLPWIYSVAFPAPSGEPFCSFSPVNNKWVISKSVPGEKPQLLVLESESAEGPVFSTITRDERDSLVPQMFYKELLAHDRLPDTIGGKAVSAHELRTHELMLNSSPRDIVKRNMGVWLMMESMPKRVDLSDPDQVFRFVPGGIEFVDMATNSVNKARSERFTKMMSERGFTFPATDLSANVTSRKPYDEGYLMVDAAGKPFHVKQQAGRPYVTAIEMPGGAKAAKVFIMEDMNKDVLGFIADTDNNFYILEREGYKVMPLPIGKVDPSKQSILVMGNLFNYACRISSEGESDWRAVARTPEGYQLLGAYDFKKEPTTAAKVADYIFPYALTFTSHSDSLAYPRIVGVSFAAIYLNVLLALVLFVVIRRQKRCTPYLGCAATLVCGLFAFIPCYLLKD